MKIVQLPDGYGKSIIAIHAAINNKVPLVVPTAEDKDRVLNIFNELKCRNPLDCKVAQSNSLKVITWSEYLSDSRYRKLKNIVIDDLDKILETQFEIETEGLTITTK